jgi:hypothetical protein
MCSEEALAITIGGLFLFAFLGFQGVSADNTQYLLGALERINADFLANDWFVQTTESFHPLFEIYMTWWLRIDQLVAGLFVWYAINLLLLCAAVLMLLKYFGQSERLNLGMIVALGMLLAGVRYGWGMYEILTGQALPAYLAYPPAIASIVFLFNRRFLLAAGLVAITFLVHHGLGALLVLCMLGPAVVTLPRTRREWVQAGIGAAIVLAAFLPVVIGTLNKDAGQVEDFAILFYGRSPQHFAVQYSDLQTHLMGLHIFASSLILAFAIRTPEIRLKVLILVVNIAVLCALGYLLLEVWYTPAFVRLFPFRAIPILVVLNSCIIASVLLDTAATVREKACITLMALSSVFFQYSITLSFALLATALVLPALKTMGRQTSTGNARAVLTIVCVAIAISLGITTLKNRPLFFQQWPAPFQLELASALNKYTSKNSVIVVPPWLSGVRISAERAIVVNTKNFPVYGPEMVQWADRMHDVSGVDPRQAKQYLQIGANIWQSYAQGYQSRSLQDLVTAAHKYKADFILVRSDSRYHWEAGQKKFHSLWSGNGYALYEVPDSVG